MPTSSTDKECIDSIIFLILSRIYPVQTVKQALLFLSPDTFLLILITFFFSIAMTMGIESVRLAGSILLDEPKETYPRLRADTMLRALCRRLSGTPT